MVSWCIRHSVTALLCSVVLLPSVLSATPLEEARTLSEVLFTDMQPEEGFFLIRCDNNQVYRLPATLRYTHSQEEKSTTERGGLVTLAAVVLADGMDCRPVWYASVLLSEEQTVFSTQPRPWTKELSDFVRMGVAELLHVVKAQEGAIKRVREDIRAEERLLEAARQKQRDSVALEYLSSPVFRIGDAAWEQQMLEKHIALLRAAGATEEKRPVLRHQKRALTSQVGKLAAAAQQVEERTSSRAQSRSQAQLVMKGRTVDIAALENSLERLRARTRALRRSQQQRSVEEEYLLSEGEDGWQ